MNIEWKIDPSDIVKVTEVVKRNSNRVLVRGRRLGLVSRRTSVTKEAFWKMMVYARLTSQQKSGPQSPVAQFMRTKPFPLSYETVRSANRRSAHITAKLRAAGGLRFSEKIGKDLADNLELLEEKAWSQTLQICDGLTREATREDERRAADFIRTTFGGFGPKQSRNLLQMLGLTRFEIPIDSRLTRWLNDSVFFFRITSTALSDENVYRFVSDGVQALCERSGVLPCILDAAVFSDEDQDDWPDEGV
jgi:hypothetical protein